MAVQLPSKYNLLIIEFILTLLVKYIRLSLFLRGILYFIGIILLLCKFNISVKGYELNIRSKIYLTSWRA